jgi:succinate dehydrogenase cytochrome b556 subunit
MTASTPQPTGVWAWIWQRITAVLLVLLLGAHMVVLHFVPANLEIHFVGVAARFKSVLYLLIDSGLLVFGMYHGMNGVRNILFDFAFANKWRGAINAVMWIVIIAYSVWGAYALTFFLR